jgi:multiple sugar transport system substrate-binding protein
MKKIASLLITALLAMSVLAGCSTGNKSNNNAGTKNGVTTITFWAAPNPPQQVFWKDMADKFMKQNKNIVVKVSPMKETPSSEASIQTAIAGHNAPTMSENINRSFAAELANSKAIIPLDTLSGWDKIVSGRHMENTLKPWKFSDNHQYVLPLYSNAMLFAWRTDYLKELGYSQPPKTYSEVLDFVKKFKKKYPEKYLWAKADLADPTAWMRWFDFFMLYNAASDGNSFISGDKFVGDKKAGVQVLQFMEDLHNQNALLTKQSTDPFETGLSAFTDIGPWTFTAWADKYPDMKINKTFVLTTPPVPDTLKTDHVKTYADAKGVVIYAQATKAQQKAAMKFAQFVYSNPKNDLELMQKTSLLPARDDLSTNSAFTAFFNKHPELKPYAAEIPYAIPAIDNPKYNDLQTFIGQDAFNPAVKGTVDPEKGWDAMQKAIEGALK